MSSRMYPIYCVCVCVCTLHVCVCVCVCVHVPHMFVCSCVWVCACMRVHSFPATMNKLSLRKDNDTSIISQFQSLSIMGVVFITRKQ